MEFDLGKYLHMQNNTLKIKKKIPHCCNIHVLPQDCKYLERRQWAIHVELKMPIYKRVPQTTSSVSTAAWYLNANLLFSGHTLNIPTGHMNTNQNLLFKTMPIQASAPRPCSKLPASLSYQLPPNILESPSNTKQWSKMWRSTPCEPSLPALSLFYSLKQSQPGLFITSTLSSLTLSH